MVLRSNAGHCLLILEVSRSHTMTHHSRWDSSGRVISSSQRPLPDNTQHSQQTNNHAPGWIRTRDLSRRVAADLTSPETYSVSIIRTLKMETEYVSENLVLKYTWLSARQDFTEFYHRHNFNTYNGLMLVFKVLRYIDSGLSLCIFMEINTKIIHALWSTTSACNKFFCVFNPQATNVIYIWSTHS